jgi:hypothetical protein
MSTTWIIILSMIYGVIGYTTANKEYNSKENKMEYPWWARAIRWPMSFLAWPFAWFLNGAYYTYTQE